MRSTIMSHVIRGIATQKLRDLTDCELLSLFVKKRDESAFAVLMQRHTGMVQGVCRRILHQNQDAEDACQAAFLVLARKASSISKGESLASWLHGVGYRIALRLRTRSSRQTCQELNSKELPMSDHADDVTWREAMQILDEELNRLHTHYRTPLILCYLEGKTHDEASKQLGWSLGAFRGRLERGRERLRARLTKRGVTLPAVLFGAGLSYSAASASVLPKLTAGLAANILSKSNASQPDSSKVAALANTELRSLLLTKVQLATAIAIVLGFLSIGIVRNALADRSQDAVTSAKADQASKAKPKVFTQNERQKKNDSPQKILTLSAPVKRMRWSRDGSLMASFSERKQVKNGKTIRYCTFRIWDAKTGKMKQSFGEVKNQGVSWYDFSPDGKRLAISYRQPIERGDKIELYDIANANLFRTIDMPYGRSRVNFAFSPDGNTLAVCCAVPGKKTLRGSLRLYDLATGKLKQTLVCDAYLAISASFSPDGKRIAAGCHSGGIAVWDVSSAKLLKTLKTDDRIMAFAISPDNKHLAAGSGEDAVTLWNLKSAKPKVLKGPAALMQDLAFSPDGRHIAGVGWVDDDGKRATAIRLWNVRTGRLLREWPVSPRGFSFTPDGKRLAILHDEKTVKLWNITVGAKSNKSAKPNKTADADEMAVMQYVNRLRAAVKKPLDRQEVYRLAIKPMFQRSVVWAARKGKDGLVCELYQLYAGQPNRTTHGKTALAWAAGHNDAAVIKILLARGLSPNVRDTEGRTALHHSIGWDAKNVKLLLQHKVEVTALTKTGLSPLMLAAAAPDSVVVKMLIGKGAKIHESDSNGQTPLMYAAKNGRAKNAKLLIQHGAQRAAKDNKGQIALDLLKAPALLTEARGIVSVEQAQQLSLKIDRDLQELKRLLSPVK